MTQIPVSKVLPNPEQPRTVFDKAELEGLAQSIKANGLIQPIVVEHVNGNYILVDGERRLRAVKLLGLKQIEAFVRAPKNHRANGRRLAAMVANVQRADLGPIDQAKAYQQLLIELGTIAAVCRKVGVTSNTVGNRLDMLTLAEPVQRLFQAGQLPLVSDVIAKFKKLPRDEQVRISAVGITRGWSAKSFNRILNKTLAGKGLKPPPKKKYETIQVKLAGDHFDALALVFGWQDLSEKVQREARKVCQECELYAEACKEICGRCPLPAFLSRYRLATKEL